MHLFWAWTHYGSEIGIPGPPVRSGHVEIEMPDAMSTVSTPDLYTWLACTLAGPTYDDPLLPDGTEIAEELLSLLEDLGESDASDLLNAFAASRTDTALAALVAAWEANHKDDGDSFHFSQITRTEMIISYATSDDHGYGNAFGLSTSVRPAALGVLVNSAMEDVVHSLESSCGWRMW